MGVTLGMVSQLDIGLHQSLYTVYHIILWTGTCFIKFYMLLITRIDRNPDFDFKKSTEKSIFAHISICSFPTLDMVSRYTSHFISSWVDHHIYFTVYILYILYLFKVIVNKIPSCLPFILISILPYSLI